MISYKRRLETIELTLTPSQIVLMWLHEALQSKLDDVALQPQWPRETLWKSISRTVRSNLKGQPELVVERAVRQARQEGDLLYNIVVMANISVQREFERRCREWFFVCQFLKAMSRREGGTDSEAEFRAITLSFVEEVLVMDEVILQISHERFGGNQILFLDSASKLRNQLYAVDVILERFNMFARASGSKELSVDEIRDRLRPDANEQVAHWLGCARANMLAAFGEDRDLRPVLRGLILGGRK